MILQTLMQRGRQALVEVANASCDRRVFRQGSEHGKNRARSILDSARAPLLGFVRLLSANFCCFVATVSTSGFPD